ncbi:hypothetical protein B0H19DRAFT_1253039 [Mycena capillaripes]|nr:hypothetical protein B0H19DRAFT_1253039 [Mycena capillaripes]
MVRCFDRFLSVEMMENVGFDFIAEYWGMVEWALKPATAIGVVQVLTMPEARINEYNQSADFIQKMEYGSLCFLLELSVIDDAVFPGTTFLVWRFYIETTNRGSRGRLTVDSVFNIGAPALTLHPARVEMQLFLFFAGMGNTVIAANLETTYQLDHLDLEVFKRKWLKLGT